MNDVITIDTARFGDLAAILALQKECYRENAERYNNYCIRPLMQTQQEIEREFETSVFLKAISASEIVGSIRGCAKFSTCHISRLFVHPHHQNRGIAKQLIFSIENHFSGVDRFEGFTGYKDDKNLALYHKLGYSTFKLEQREDGMIFLFLEKIR